MCTCSSAWDVIQIVFLNQHSGLCEFINPVKNTITEVFIWTVIVLFASYQIDKDMPSIKAILATRS